MNIFLRIAFNICLSRLFLWIAFFLCILSRSKNAVINMMLHYDNSLWHVIESIFDSPQEHTSLSIILIQTKSFEFQKCKREEIGFINVVLVFCMVFFFCILVIEIKTKLRHCLSHFNKHKTFYVFYDKDFTGTYIVCSKYII